MVSSQRLDAGIRHTVPLVVLTDDGGHQGRSDGAMIELGESPSVLIAPPRTGAATYA